MIIIDDERENIRIDVKYGWEMLSHRPFQFDNWFWLIHFHFIYVRPFQRHWAAATSCARDYWWELIWLCNWRSKRKKYVIISLCSAQSHIQQTTVLQHHHRSISDKPLLSATTCHRTVINMNTARVTMLAKHDSCSSWMLGYVVFFCCARPRMTCAWNIILFWLLLAATRGLWKWG